MRRDRWVAAGLALLLFSPAQAADPRAPSNVATEIRAQLAAKRSAILSTEVAGRIAELSVREGDHFKQGQRLVGLDCAMHQARLDRARAGAEAARKTLETNKRLETLNSVGKLEVEMALAEFAKANADAALMHEMVERCAILAPFAGRVAELKVRQFQYVAEGEALIDIIDDQDPEVELIVPSRWLVWLKPGLRFTMHLDETERDYPCEISQIGARIDPVSQSIKLRGRIIGHFDELLPGMSGRVMFPTPG